MSGIPWPGIGEAGLQEDLLFHGLWPPCLLQPRALVARCRCGEVDLWLRWVQKNRQPSLVCQVGVAEVLSRLMLWSPQKALLECARYTSTPLEISSPAPLLLLQLTQHWLSRVGWTREFRLSHFQVLFDPVLNLVSSLFFSSGGSQGGRPGGRETAVVRFLPQQQWDFACPPLLYSCSMCKEMSDVRKPIHGCVLIYRALLGNIKDIFVKSCCYQLNTCTPTSSQYWMKRGRKNSAKLQMAMR